MATDSILPDVLERIENLRIDEATKGRAELSEAGSVEPEHVRTNIVCASADHLPPRLVERVPAVRSAPHRWSSAR